ncbi:hypothetical protein Thpro_021099 [Acidihalobacter prosperus]|uniref:Uncharacterized protein n=1 Tax=Acidihalobacter prosperus TaxID=160660 RepID=A0A1A6C661_9GAMM|nr:hypothetical protein Thpro_021099 [Acidihalobacter prosperus]
MGRQCQNVFAHSVLHRAGPRRTPHRGWTRPSLLKRGARH